MAFAFSTDAANKVLSYLFKVGGTLVSSFTDAGAITLFTSADSSLGAIAASWAAASGGKTASASVAGSMAAGTIAKARLGSSNPTTAFLTVGTTGSGADVILSTLTGGGSVTAQQYSFAVLAAGSGGAKLNVALRNAIADLYRGGGSPARLVTSTTGATARMRLYSGSPPDSADTAATGTMLWDREMLAADFNTPASGQVGLASTLVVNASATGTVGYGRLERSSGACVQFLVATDTSADAQVDSLSAVSGTPLTMQTFVFALI